MKQETEIDVMIADASHEIYVDKILTTIEEAAKVRGTGIAKRTHEYVAQNMIEGKAGSVCRFQLYRIVGQQAVCDDLRFNCSSGFPWFGYCQTDQGYDVSTGPHALAEG